MIFISITFCINGGRVNILNDKKYLTTLLKMIATIPVIYLPMEFFVRVLASPTITNLVLLSVFSIIAAGAVSYLFTRGIVHQIELKKEFLKKEEENGEIELN